ncbi:MAG: hypothetical protein H7039_13235 [Bryobacteraceae bacterium]|nr:hypothetical protein [Bryobacteraceae bacterium]
MKVARARVSMWSVFLVLLSIALSSLLGALLMAAHLPAPVDPSGLPALLSREPGRYGGWQAVHVIAAGCNCSLAVADYLVNRRPLKHLKERVVIAGSDELLLARLAKSSFSVTTLPAEEAANRYHLRGAPWLIFLSPDGKVAYAGGYAATAAALDGYQDARIWEQLQAGSSVRELPAFGCVTGRRLQRAIDPLGLKYGS